MEQEHPIRKFKDLDEIINHFTTNPERQVDMSGQIYFITCKHPESGSYSIEAAMLDVGTAEQYLFSECKDSDGMAEYGIDSFTCSIPLESKVKIHILIYENWEENKLLIDSYSLNKDTLEDLLKKPQYKESIKYYKIQSLEIT